MVLSRVSLSVIVAALGVAVGWGDPVFAQYGNNTCRYANDGECDDPTVPGHMSTACAPGTDANDCANPAARQGMSRLYNPCPYRNDGECDEPNGLNHCAWGTDPEDCSNPNSDFGHGSGYAGGSSHPTPGVAPSAGAGGISTYSPWRVFARQQGNFAAQPATSWPLDVRNGRVFQAGDYVIYSALVSPNGVLSNITTYRARLDSDTRYLASASSTGHTSFWSDPRLIQYSAPGPGHAMIYARNEDMMNDRALCVLPAGWPQTMCNP